MQRMILITVLLCVGCTTLDQDYLVEQERLEERLVDPPPRTIVLWEHRF